MWNRRSPVSRRHGVHRRGSPGMCAAPPGAAARKNRSHASDPNAMTHERSSSRSRNPTARTSAARSAQSERTAWRLSSPGFSATTRKIAARVSGAATGCGIRCRSACRLRRGHRLGTPSDYRCRCGCGVVVLHASEPFSWNEIMPDYAGIGKVTYPQATSFPSTNHSRAVLSTRRMLPGNTEER